MVAFTALSNQLDEDRIGDLVEIFESRCADVVAGQRGRVIKSLGDSVLFVNEDPIRAFDIAEGIIEVIGRDPRMPDVRVGLATGSVVMRLGDVFGPAGEHGGPADRGGPAQPGHHRRGDRRPAAGGPVRDPAAARRGRCAGSASSSRSPYAGTERSRTQLCAVRAAQIACQTRFTDSGPRIAHSPARRGAWYLFSIVLEVQDVHVDPATRRVWRTTRDRVLAQGVRPAASPDQRAGAVVTRDELMRDVWHTTFWTSSKTIDVHLGWVRRKLGDDPGQPDLITTVRGHGLRFETQAAELPGASSARPRPPRSDPPPAASTLLRVTPRALRRTRRPSSPSSAAASWPG